MYDLIRFFNKPEHVQSFLDGELYMNSIGHFWKHGDETRNDICEGVGETLSAEEYATKYGIDFRNDFGDHIILPIMNRPEIIKYVHIVCFVLHRYDPSKREVERIDTRMRNFGEYAVRVHNLEAFNSRIFEKLQENGQYGLMGPVDYHDLTEKSTYRDCFDKDSLHSFEQEWRFAVIPDYEEAKQRIASNPEEIYDEHHTFSIGDIHGFAEEIDVDTLFREPEKYYRTKNGQKYKPVDKLTITLEEQQKIFDVFHKKTGLPLPYDANPKQYVGWGGREEFRNKVLQLDGRIKPLLVIG